MAAMEGKEVEAAFVAEHAGVKEVLSMGKPAENLLKAIMKRAVRLSSDAKALRKLLEDKGIVDDLTMWKEVNENKLLKATITKFLGAGLEEDITKSLFGLNLVSDFNLFNNCFSNNQFLAFVGSAFVGSLKLSLDQSEDLKKSRDKLIRLVTRTRENLIEDMEFGGGAPIRSHKAKPILKNAGQLIQMANDGVEAAAVVAGQKRAAPFDSGHYRDTDDEDYEEEDVPANRSSSSSSSSSSGSNRVLEGRVLKVLKWYPNLEHGHHLVYFEGELITKNCSSVVVEST